MIPSPLFIKNYFVVMSLVALLTFLKRPTMEEKASEQQMPKCLPKLPTGIRGLDKVLYGEIDANVLNPLYIKEQSIERTPLVIVIRGNEDVQ